MAPAAGPSWRRHREAALLLATVAIAYANSFYGSYQFDDFAAIVDEPAVQGLAAWRESMPGMRPLLKLSYAANHALGAGLAGLHAVNLAIHAASVLVCWALLSGWLPRAGFDPVRARRAGLVAALVFALHPLQTEAVTYLSGRSMALMGLLSLGALHLAMQASGPRDWRTPAATGLFVMALMVRETAWAVVPALALLLATSGMPLRREAWRLGPFVTVLLLAAVLFWSLPAYRALALSTLTRHEFPALLATQVDAVFYLLTRPLLLLELNIDPDLRPATGFGAAGALRAGVLLILTAAAVWQWRARPWLAAALLWPFVMLIPNYSLFARADLANDRHLYLAMLGPAILVGAALASLPRRSGMPATLLLCSLLLLVTVGRNQDYRSETALWRATSVYSPDKARVWNNLGFALMTEGDLPGARAALRRALILDPDHLKARYNLAEVEVRARAAD